MLATTSIACSSDCRGRGIAADQTGSRDTQKHSAQCEPVAVILDCESRPPLQLTRVQQCDVLGTQIPEPSLKNSALSAGAGV